MLFPFPLFSSHIQRVGILPDPAIPALFATAILVDAATGLVYSALYDRFGLWVLLVLPTLSAIAAPLAFSGHPVGLILGVAIWGGCD